MALPLTYKAGNCFINAFINKRHHYKNKNLKLVYGSLAINGWFEFGGKDWTLKEFKERNEDGSHRWDAHAWLEDDEGNIYDYVFKRYDRIARIRTKRCLPYTGILEGRSKAECEAMGITYVPAPPEVSKAIFVSQFKVLKDTETGLLLGLARWFGKGEDGLLFMSGCMPENKNDLLGVVPAF